MITGLAPIQAIVHIKSLNMLWRICSDVNSIEYQIIIRQLAMKSWRSLSWVTYIRHILSRLTYQIFTSCYNPSHPDPDGK